MAAPHDRSASLCIGLISDTHGLMRPETLAALAGVDHIIHAGDIGNATILDQLADIAPVTAIRGNNDTGAWASELPDVTLLEKEGVRIYVIHDLKELGKYGSPASPQVIVSGHSHRPSVKSEQGVLYLNPGSAGPRRFRLPVTLALLRIKEGQPQAEIVSLLP